MFVEKGQFYSDSRIKSLMTEAIKTAMSGLKRKVKAAKSVEEIKSLVTLLPKEIDALKSYLTGTIVLSINELLLNEAVDFSSILFPLKNAIKDLVSKKDSVLDKAKKDYIARIDQTEEDLLKYIKSLDINVEKSNAKIAKFAGKSFKLNFLV
jgi:hypothetical protein